MKINKENLGKIIQTLQSKYSEMSDKDYLDFSSVKFNIEKEFIVPKLWYLSKELNEYQLDIVNNWLLKGTSEEWTENDCEEYYLHGSYFEYSNGYQSPEENAVLISFEDFEKYIANRKNED